MGLCIVCTDDYRQIAQKYRLYQDQLILIDGMGIDVARFEKNDKTGNERRDIHETKNRPHCNR